MVSVRQFTTPSINDRFGSNINFHFCMLKVLKDSLPNDLLHIAFKLSKITPVIIIITTTIIIIILFGRIV